MSPTKEQIHAYVARVGGKRASTTFSLLGKNQQFVKALQTPLGQELLRDIQTNIEYLTRKVVLDDDAKSEDKMLLRAYIRIGEDWSERINKLEKSLSEITGSAKPETD